MDIEERLSYDRVRFYLLDVNKPLPAHIEDTIVNAEINLNGENTSFYRTIIGPLCAKFNEICVNNTRYQDKTMELFRRFCLVLYGSYEPPRSTSRAYDLIIERNIDLFKIFNATITETFLVYMMGEVELCNGDIFAQKVTVELLRLLLASSPNNDKRRFLTAENSFGENLLMLFAIKGCDYIPIKLIDMLIEQMANIGFPSGMTMIDYQDDLTKSSVLDISIKHTNTFLLRRLVKFFSDKNYFIPFFQKDIHNKIPLENVKTLSQYYELFNIKNYETLSEMYRETGYNEIIIILRKLKQHLSYLSENGITPDDGYIFRSTLEPKFHSTIDGFVNILKMAIDKGVKIFEPVMTSRGNFNDVIGYMKFSQFPDDITNEIFIYASFNKYLKIDVTEYRTVADKFRKQIGLGELKCTNLSDDSNAYTSHLTLDDYTYSDETIVIPFNNIAAHCFAADDLAYTFKSSLFSNYERGDSFNETERAYIIQTLSKLNKL